MLFISKYIDGKKVIVVNDSLDQETPLKAARAINEFCSHEEWEEAGFRYVTANPFTVLKKSQIFKEAIDQGKVVRPDDLGGFVRDFIDDVKEEIEKEMRNYIVVGSPSAPLYPIGLALHLREQSKTAEYRDIALEKIEEEAVTLQGKKVILIDVEELGNVVAALTERKEKYGFDLHVLKPKKRIQKED